MGLKVVQPKEIVQLKKRAIVWGGFLEGQGLTGMGVQVDGRNNGFILDGRVFLKYFGSQFSWYHQFIPIRSNDNITMPPFSRFLSDLE